MNKKCNSALIIQISTEPNKESNPLKCVYDRPVELKFTPAAVFRNRWLWLVRFRSVAGNIPLISRGP